MKDEGIEDPVSWSLEQLKTRFPAYDFTAASPQ
jgi:hypothetical protein